MNEPETAPNVHKTVRKMLPIDKESILDLGCGNNAFLNGTTGYIKKTGIDKPQCDLNKEIPIPNETYDVITCIEVIEHLENPTHLMREAYRILKENGTFVLTTPNNKNWYSRIYFLLTGRMLNCNWKEHITIITREKLFLGGFVIEETKYNRAFIPIFRFDFKTNYEFLGEILILKLRKNGGCRK